MVNGNVTTKGGFDQIIHIDETLLGKRYVTEIGRLLQIVEIKKFLFVDVDSTIEE